MIYKENTNHNEMRKNICELIAEVQSYSFGSVISSILGGDVFISLGKIVGSGYILLGHPSLTNSDVHEHDALLEIQYDLFIKEGSAFLEMIKSFSNNLTESDFSLWDSNKCKLLEVMKNPIQEEKVQDTESLKNIAIDAFGF